MASWVVVSAAIQRFEPGFLDTEYARNSFVRGELELLVGIAATLVAIFVLRGSWAALVLLALGSGEVLTGALAGLAAASISAPLFWSGLAAIAAGMLAALRAPRALLLIPVGIILGAAIWVAYLLVAHSLVT